MSLKLLVRLNGCPNCDSVKQWLKENPIEEIEFVNADENLDYCRQHNIRSVPCLVRDEKEFFCNNMAIMEELRRIKGSEDGK